MAQAFFDSDVRTRLAAMLGLPVPKLDARTSNYIWWECAVDQSLNSHSRYALPLNSPEQEFQLMSYLTNSPHVLNRLVKKLNSGLIQASRLRPFFSDLDFCQHFIDRSIDEFAVPVVGSNARVLLSPVDFAVVLVDCEAANHAVSLDRVARYQLEYTKYKNSDPVRNCKVLDLKENCGLLWDQLKSEYPNQITSVNQFRSKDDVFRFFEINRFNRAERVLILDKFKRYITQRDHRLKTAEDKPQINVRLKRATVERLDEMARRSGLSKAQVLENLINEFEIPIKTIIIPVEHPRRRVHVEKEDPT